jgi:predicted DNA-binding protein
MTGYTFGMKTAISMSDGDFERFERLAARHGMNRSEFFRAAASRFADDLEGDKELTALADAVIERTGQPSGDTVFLREAEQRILAATEW